MNNTSQNKNRPYLRSFDVLKKGVLKNGYTENFVYKNKGYLSGSNSTEYDINKVKVISTIRFQGSDNPGDHAELFMIETADGTKGTFENNKGAD